MKKFITLFIAAGFILTISSCKKDYTCECNYELDGTTVDISFDYEKAKKSEAEESCTAWENLYKIEDPNSTCTLK